MTPLDYCCRVQRLLLEVDVCPEQGDAWWRDTGRAGTAVAMALAGRESLGLAIAEEIAETWYLLV